ncbi:unnamed protein product, partial [Symbiodinium necroappetens]
MSASCPTSARVTVKVEVTVPLPATSASVTVSEGATEWVVVERSPRKLLPAVCSRLATRLSSKAKSTPKDRVEAAFAAGLRSESLLEAGSEPETPPSVGLQNTCWVGVQSAKHTWWTSRRPTADKILKGEPESWLIPFASQAEAEVPRKLPAYPWQTRWGLLLAVAASALTTEELDSRKIVGVTDDLGLVGQVDVRATLTDAQPVEVSLLLFDWPSTLNKYLRWGVPETWPPHTVLPTHGTSTELTLDRAHLCDVARAWVEEGQMAFSEAYLTGVDGEPLEPP